MQSLQENSSTVRCAAKRYVCFHTTLIIDRSEMYNIIFHILQTFRKSNIKIYKSHASKLWLFSRKKNSRGFHHQNSFNLEKERSGVLPPPLHNSVACIDNFKLGGKH
jgi:hypothetical protein